MVVLCALEIEKISKKVSKNNAPREREMMSATK